MSGWKSELIKLGEEHYLLGAAGAYGNVTGFHLTSSLLQHGLYEADFLNGYGAALLDYEERHPLFRSMLAADYWGQFGETTDLLHMDPMFGFMSALGANSEASAQFFAPPGDFDPADRESSVGDRLNYLATERAWLSDGQTPPSVFGDAILSATTGNPADVFRNEGGDEPLTDMRTREAAAVMSQVMHLYGTADQTLIHTQPGVAEPLGLMAASYIDDINYRMSGYGGYENTDHTDTFPSAYGGRISNDDASTLRFLSTVGQHEESYGIVTQAQHLYMLSNVDAHSPMGDDGFARGKQVLATGAEVRGVLDGSRVAQIEANYGVDTEAAQRELARAAEWKKFGVGAAVGAGLVLVAVPATAGISAIIVPIAAGTGGEFLQTFIDQEIDSSHSGVEYPRMEAQIERQVLFDSGAEDVSSIADGYFDMHEEDLGLAERDEIREAVKGKHREGSSLSTERNIAYIP